MFKTFLMSLALVANSSAAWSQGTTVNPNAPHGTGGAVSAPAPGGFGMPISEYVFKDQCMAHLADLATQKLKLQLGKDKAVTNQVLASAEVTESGLGGSCTNVCTQYAHISHLISWAKVSPGFLSEPEHTQQMVYRNLPQPPMPDKAELGTCLPMAATMNWCPPSGTGVGAGSSRIENPMDKIKVCVSMTDALKSMNFTAAELAYNCAKPGIADAAERVKAEMDCVSKENLAKAQADKKAAADAAAANQAAAVYNGAPLNSMPGAVGLKAAARQKP
jgi:hypothetical protein